MTKNIHIAVVDKIAKYLQRDGAIVCGNTDYQITFTFDQEWESYATKTARFIWNGKYRDQPVKSDNTCDVPKITNATEVIVGVYAGDISTTTPASIPCKRSILCIDVGESDSSDNSGGGAAGGDVALPTLISPRLTLDNYNAILTIDDAVNGKHTEQYLIYYDGKYLGYTDDLTVNMLSITDYTGNDDLRVVASATQFKDSPAASVKWTQPKLPLTANFADMVGGIYITDYDTENTSCFDVYIDDVLVHSTTDTTIMLFDLAPAVVSTRIVKVIAQSSNPYFLSSTPFQVEWVVRDNGTLGLEYSIDAENGYAMCIGRGNSTEPNIVIASTYEGYPVTKIADNAFKSNRIDYSITSIFIPEGVTHVGEYAFDNRYRIENLYIPSSLVYMGREAFTGAVNLFISDMTAWCNMVWNMPIASGDPSIWLTETNLYLNNQLVTDLIIPDDVTAIPDSRFRGVTITSVHIPSHVTSIGHAAFFNCDKLITATVPKTVTTLLQSAIGSCESLRDLIFAPSIEQLPSLVFSSCTSLKRLALSKSIKSGSSLYDEEDLASLTDLYYEGTEEEFAEVIDDLHMPINENVTIHYNVNLDNFTFPETA